MFSRATLSALGVLSIAATAQGCALLVGFSQLDEGSSDAASGNDGGRDVATDAPNHLGVDARAAPDAAGADASAGSMNLLVNPNFSQGQQPLPCGTGWTASGTGSIAASSVVPQDSGLKVSCKLCQNSNAPGDDYAYLIQDASIPAPIRPGDTIIAGATVELTVAVPADAGLPQVRVQVMCGSYTSPMIGGGATNLWSPLPPVHTTVPDPAVDSGTSCQWTLSLLDAPEGQCVLVSGAYFNVYPPE